MCIRDSDNGCEMLEELVINKPGEGSYTFVPVIGGSKHSTLMMVLGVTLIAVTGGFGLAVAAPFMASAGAGVAATATSAAVAGTTIAGGATLTTLGAGLNYLGMGLLLGGAAMMLAPDVQTETHQKNQKTTYSVGQSIQLNKENQYP